MPKPTEGTTRARVLKAAGELFGRQGFKATTVAQIEDAAGLSPGSGALYRHFPSKKALLEASLADQVATGPDLSAFMAGSGGASDLRSRLLALARAGLQRLEHERDLNRLLVRDLSDFPDLLARVRDSELRRVHEGVTRWLGAHAQPGGVDPSLLAAVVMGAVSHYWIMRDVFGGVHPFAPDEDEFLRAVADVAASALEHGSGDGDV